MADNEVSAHMGDGDLSDSGVVGLVVIGLVYRHFTILTQTVPLSSFST